MAKTEEKVLTLCSAVICEDHCYFIGTIAECAGFIKGYNERQEQDGDPNDFQIVPANAVKVAA